jgi:hypothetical protein
MGTRQVGSARTSGTGGAGPAGRTRCVSKASATASSDLQRAGHVATRPVDPAQQTGPPAGGKTTSPPGTAREATSRKERNARTAKQTNKRPDRKQRACTRRRVVVGGCVRARVCVYIGGRVRGWAWGAGAAESAVLAPGRSPVSTTIPRAHATFLHLMRSAASAGAAVESCRKHTTALCVRASVCACVCTRE